MSSKNTHSLSLTVSISESKHICWFCHSTTAELVLWNKNIHSSNISCCQYLIFLTFLSHQNEILTQTKQLHLWFVSVNQKNHQNCGILWIPCFSGLLFGSPTFIQQHFIHCYKSIQKSVAYIVFFIGQCLLHPILYILHRSRGNKKCLTEIFTTRALEERDNHKCVTDIFPTRA